MSIREYSECDYHSILNIYDCSKLDELKFESDVFELLPFEEDKVRSNQILESSIYVYGDKDIRGFCAYKGTEIRALFVHPDARGKGIGIQLLEYMLSNIAGSATLYVASSNVPAITLYQKYGFENGPQFETTYNGISVLANKMQRSKNDV